MLARQLGRTVGELMRSMPMWEYRLHRAQHRAGLWGDHREDRRVGALSAVIATYAGKSRSDDAPAATPFEFLHLIDAEPPKAVSPSEYFGSANAKT